MIKVLLFADGLPDVEPETLSIHQKQVLVEKYPVMSQGISCLE